MTVSSGIIEAIPAFALADAGVVPLPFCIGLFVFVCNPALSPLAVLSFRWGSEFVFVRLVNETHWVAQSSSWSTVFGVQQQLAVSLNDTFVCFDASVCAAFPLPISTTDDWECYLSAAANRVESISVNSIPWSPISLVSAHPTPPITFFPVFVPSVFVDLTVPVFLDYCALDLCLFDSSLSHVVDLPVVDVLGNAIQNQSVVVEWVGPLIPPFAVRVYLNASSMENL